MKFTTDQAAAMNQDARQMSRLGTGFSLPEILQRHEDLITGGSVGATAAGYDIDAVALGGGAFALNADTTSGLNLGLRAGRVRFGQSIVAYAGGTVALTPSNVNYVEFASNGAVYANTVSFTAGRCPLYTVTAGVALIDLTLAISAKALLSAVATGSVSGALLATAAATKEANACLGAVSATASFALIVPGVAGTVTAVSLATGTSLATSDSAYWTFGVVNKGTNGAGTTKVADSTAAANSTKVTGGSALTNYVARALTLGTGGNVAVNAGDVLEITLTASGGPAALPEVAVRVDVAFTA